MRQPGLLTAVLMVALSTSAPAAEYEMPRTAWGHPDLRGTYSNTTLTPFERPDALGEKAFYTEEEVAELEQERADEIASTNAAPASPAPAGGRIVGYAQHWLEVGTKVVGDRRTSLVVDPPNGRVPIRPEALAERDHNLEESFNDYVHIDRWVRCITRGVPGGFFPVGYNNNYIFVQTPETVAIYFEMIHNVRVIPLDGRPPVDEDISLWNGDSRGHWEGDTLVVETKNFNDKGWAATSGKQGQLKGIMQTEDTHVIERFTRLDDNTINYRVTVTDSAKYTSPWTAQIPLYTQEGLVLFEYACHEGNWGVHNTLSGARAQERAASSSSE